MSSEDFADSPLPEGFAHSMKLVLAARVYRLGRFMMAQNPWEAELGLSVPPLLREAVESGRGVVRMELPEGAVSYVVVRGDHRYTTSRRPRWVKESEVVGLKVEWPEPALLPMLSGVCAELRAADPEAYEMLGCGRILSAASAYYGEPGLDQQVMDDIQVRLLLSEVPPGFDPQAPTESGVMDWADRCTSLLSGQYGQLTLSGDAVLRAFAALFFMRLSPAPQQLFGLGLGPYEVERALRTEVGEQVEWRPNPLLEIGFYLMHPALFGHSTFVPLRRGARMLQRHANELLHQARTQPGFGRFHALLYFALLYYRAAHYMFGVLLSSKVRRALPKPLYMELVKDLEGVKRDHSACEERRVTILASLTRVVRGEPTEPDFTDVPQVISWFNLLSAAADEEAAELHVHDLYMRLLCPRFMRDLALGSLRVRSELTYEDGRRRLLEVAQFLEANIHDNHKLGEANYITLLYDILATAALRAGREEESRAFAKKATQEYIGELGSRGV